MPFWPHPIPYLPFFLVFLVPLSYIHPLQSFFVWTIFNLIFSMGYLIIWLKRIRCKVKDRTGLTILILILLSIQSFLNLTFGQVNIILLIATGETLFNLTQGKYTTAGFWIGFGWIKPQAILLIIIVFLLRRNWHFITGFTYSSIIISITSMLLAGWKGIEGVITTLKNWPSLYRSSGMTWLSAVDHLVFQGVPLTIAYGLGLTLVIIILIAWIKILQRCWINSTSNRLSWDKIFITTLSTQAIIMPHGNVHMAIVIAIPWLVFLCKNKDPIGWYTFLNWSLISGLFFLITAYNSVGHAHNLLGMLILLAHILNVFYFYNIQPNSNQFA